VARSLRPLGVIFTLVLCVAACGAPGNSPAAAPSTGTAATATTVVPSSIDQPATEPPPTDEPIDKPTNAPALSTGPAPSPPPLAEGVEVLSVEIADERMRDLMIQTPSLPDPVGVRLLLPANFDTEPDRKWPVFYLLHGAGGDADSFRYWTYNTDVQALVAPTNLLVVMPQADGFGWYSDWWNNGEGGPPMWETFHLTELMVILERDWHASDQRAVAGLSMGGYGAMAYAARHPGVFKAAASFSGPLDILGEKDSGLLGQDLAVWGDPVQQEDVWRAHNPIDLAEALGGTTLYISYGEGGQGPLDPEPVGDDGEAFRSISNRAFVQRLEDLGIPATVDAYGPATHTWPYFERALHNFLPLALEAVGEGS
jgi:S-formylglutathione hydrolase FrmB